MQMGRAGRANDLGVDERSRLSRSLVLAFSRSLVLVSPLSRSPGSSALTKRFARFAIRSQNLFSRPRALVRPSLSLRIGRPKHARRQLGRLTMARGTEKTSASEILPRAGPEEKDGLAAAEG